MENRDATILTGSGDAAVSADFLGAPLAISNYKRAHRTTDAYFEGVVQGGGVESGAEAVGGRYVLLVGEGGRCATYILASTRESDGGEYLPDDWKCDTIRILGVVDAAIDASRWWQRAFSHRGRASAVPSGVHTGARRAADLAGLFHRLADQWRAETAVLSSARAMAMHPAYQRIIGMGPRVLPLILRELQREPDHWFWALYAITGENPVAPEDAGDVGKMAEAWVQLARERGWV